MEGFNDSLDKSVDTISDNVFYGLTAKESFNRARIMLLSKGSLMCDQDMVEKKCFEIVYANQKEVREYLAELGLELVVRLDLREPYITWRPLRDSRFGSIVMSSVFKRDRSVFYLLLAKIFYNPGQSVEDNKAAGLGPSVFYKTDLWNDFKRYVKADGDSAKVFKKFNYYFKESLVARFIFPVPGDNNKFRIHSFFESFLTPEDYIEFSNNLVDYAMAKDTVVEDDEGEVEDSEQG